MCLPHGLRDMCMISLRLSAFNEYGSGVIDILTGKPHNKLKMHINNRTGSLKKKITPSNCNDVSLDGMLINVATLLAGGITNPFGNAYFQGLKSVKFRKAIRM